MPEQPADAELQAELAPLAAVIANTLRTTPTRLDDPTDLIAALTVRVAAYMGGIVPGGDERARHRDQVLAEGVELIRTAQATAETHELDRHGYLDHETHLARAAVHWAADLLLAARSTPDAPSPAV